MNKLRSNDDDGRFLEIDVFKDVSMSNFIFLETFEFRDL